jgi:hypothetical protein
MPAFCGEGMWIPVLLDSLNIKDMQEKGLKLTAEDIYSINKSSLKDAVVIFGNGCTGELISGEGLLITNHHCGYSRIQAHSTVEHNYLANGFWADSKSEELTNPGLSVTFLVRMEDVTGSTLVGVSDSLDSEARNGIIATNINNIRNEAIGNTHYKAEVKSFYYGLQYYLFVYEVFNDVRLVGTPPELIGNFGGDSDNWIWPRHTGDFSLFRIYAGKDNKPADYSPDNIPYKPGKYFNISTAGVKEGDFTMVLGYPGRTDQFLTSDALDLIARQSLPAKVEMRTVRLNTLKEIMSRSAEYKLKYASRYVGISNSWKKWMGATQGLERAGIVQKKKEQELVFQYWANELTADPNGFQGLMEQFSRLYKVYRPLYLANDLGGELLNSLEVSSLVNKVQIRFFSVQDSSDQYRQKVLQELRQLGSGFFRSNGLEIDRKNLPALLRIYAQYSNEEFHPAFYQTIARQYGNNYDAFVADIFDNSLYTDSVRFRKVLSKPAKVIREKIIHDPLMPVYRDFSMMLLTGASDRLDSMERKLKELYKTYVTGLMTMNPSRTFYPDANFTMRLTYGAVEGYNPMDAVHYQYYSTLTGVIEKEDSSISDYSVPERLKTLYNSGDFAPYGVLGKLPVCFIATNHTSGGNSGSPVINAYGDLVGINFDRNWEGTMSDYAYDPVVCRNISLDARYVLFIIDKYANADWLLRELTLINR